MKIRNKELTDKNFSGYEFKTGQRVRLNTFEREYNGKEGRVLFQKNDSLVIVDFDDIEFARSGHWHPSCLEKI